MAKKKSKKKQKRLDKKAIVGGKASMDPTPDSRTVMDRLEFHRNGVALLPSENDEDPGVAIMVFSKDKSVSRWECSCDSHNGSGCHHLKRLSRLYRNFSEANGSAISEENFRSGIWHKIAAAIGSMKRIDLGSIVVLDQGRDPEARIVVLGKDDEVLLDYRSPGPDAARLSQRLDNRHFSDWGSRFQALEKLRKLTISPNEYQLSRFSKKSRRQVFEAGFWHMAAYHAFREFGNGGFSIRSQIDQNTGRFTINAEGRDGKPDFRLTVPKAAINRLLTDPTLPLSEKDNLTLSSTPVKPILRVRMDKRGTIRLKPLYLHETKKGELVYITPEELSKFKFGNMLCLPGTQTMVPIEAGDDLFQKFDDPEGTVIKKARVPEFLETHGRLLQSGAHLVDDRIAALKVYRRSERVEIEPKALERDWCWISIKYGYGNSNVSLWELLDARKKKIKYFPVSDGWIDIASSDSDILEMPVGPSKEPNHKEDIQMRRSDILRLQASLEIPVKISGDSLDANLIRKMLKLKPATPLPDIRSMTSSLRKYQELGLQWLWFLHENAFGGLLCDDMGLGKTHQVMALMVCLFQKKRTPFLVVCPTTVISHWEKKIREHAPILNATVYHGTDREFQKSIEDSSVLITSYGILLRDIEKLKQVRFSLCVFDEIQNLKNPETQSCKSAMQIVTDMRLGLTGTPIENSIMDLKTLMDLTVPSYLGRNSEFQNRYVEAVEQSRDDFQKDHLARLISPFTLRRLKSSVLHELPEKIEDIRFCGLSQDQARLYLDALESRKKGLIDNLADTSARIPYIHIFALLALLKQICDHPAILEKTTDNYENWESGKWELFKEILDESLESGQKVVIYSQFLGMIDIIEKHLEKKGIGFAVLTGKSRNRGKIISRFNTDPECRVFVGSLKAGGTGIDLVAASVVIHYDRWWNAAKEDQATDRVHRIGQRRGVQVFKLVTEGTLEEKISAIIEKKRNLMESVVREDDPNLLKTFTREELLDLLAPPGAS